VRPAVAVLACALACAGWPAAAHGATAEHLRADPGAAREEARDVLAERRFQPTSLPAPLRDARERVGEWLRSAGTPFESAFRWIADRVPGGPPVLWALLATLVLALAALLAGRAGAARETAGATAAGHREDRLDAARLRREAERAGDLEEALRLRFRAGLVELDHRELIELRPALTNSELLGAVPSPTLAELVDSFDAVAYGGRPAAEDDVRSARDGWPRVPDEAARP